MSTLVEQELEQAAGISEALARYLVKTNAPNAAASALGVFSGRLRARAALVRDFPRVLSGDLEIPGVVTAEEMFSWLTGPIPAAETAPSERKEP